MFPILINLWGFKLATYGVFVALGYLVGIGWLKSRMADMGLDERRFWSLIYCLFLGAILGGKILYALLEWNRFSSGEMHFLRDFRFGFVFYGGLLGTLLMGFVYRYFTGVSYLKIADYFGVALALGHPIGRLGCLAAGCCYGRPTSLPWGIRYTNLKSLVPERLLGVRLHPTQLYEALGSALLAAALWRVLGRIEKDELREGTAFYGYLIAYAVLRFFVEIFRGDDRGGFWLGLSPSQLIALASVAVVVPLLWKNGLWTKKSA